MTLALRKPRMTREQFFDWAEAQDAHYEFDGVRPVPMAGNPISHSLIAQNIYAALHARLRDSGCWSFGFGAGLATVGDAVRYPDALVTCTRPPGSAHVVPGVLVVFEVLSPTSGRVDRIEKLGEYRAVASIRRYVIVEYGGMGLTVFERAEDQWTATALISDDTLRMPEIAIEVPVAEFYADVDLAGSAAEA